MTTFIMIRLSTIALTIFVLSVAIFLSVRMTGDPATYLLGSDAGQAEYDRLRETLGLNRPLVEQYLQFVSNALQGNLGTSVVSGRPVSEILWQRFPATLQLAGAAFAFAVLVGVPLGVLSAIRPRSAIDNIGKTVAVVGIATPNFWLATMLILLFGVILGWLPTHGYGGVEHLILPAFVLGLGAMAGIMRLTRSSMLESLDSEYVKFARVKGLPERSVITRHALKNSFLPVLTFGGLTLAALLNGSVVIEVVFGWPGIGRLMLDGISQRDFPVVQATVLVAGTLFLLTSLLVDVIYAYANPRIRVT